MRTKLLLLMLALFALPAGAADLITRWLVITNAPLGNTNSVTLNGSVRTYTNTVSGSPATLIAQTNVIGWAATNTANQLTTYRVSFGHQITLGTNYVAVRGAVGENLTLSINACCFGYITNSTQSVSTPTFLVRVPLTVEAASNQVNIGSLLVQGMSTSSTQAFATNSSAISNALIKGASPLQTVASPMEFFGRVSVNSNFFATNGFTSALTNINPVSSNLVNYGNAIRSEGSGGNSLQIGSNSTALSLRTMAIGNSAIATNTDSMAVGTSATATNGNATAIGVSAQAWDTGSTSLGAYAKAKGLQSTAIGYGSISSNDNSTAVGSGSAANIGSAALGFQAVASGTGAVSVGSASLAEGQYSIAIGSSAYAADSNSVAIGTQSTTTSSNQIQLGTSTTWVQSPGIFADNTYTNSTLKGMTVNGGDQSFVSSAISSVADGHNTINVGTNVYVRITGSPSAAWTLGAITGGNRDGKILIIENATALDMTIQNESGTEPTAANRILTYAGAGGVTNVLVTGSGVAEFIYSGTLSRWILRSPSVDVISVSTNANYTAGVGTSVGIPFRLLVITNDVTVTNTTAETSLINAAAIGTYTIPANFFTPGMSLRFVFNGKHTANGGAPASTIAIKFGSTIIASNVAVWPAASTIVNKEWHIDATATCRLTGASGGVKGAGSFTHGDSLDFAYQRDLRLGNTFDTATVDTTAAQTVNITITPGASTTGITTTDGFILVIP